MAPGETSDSQYHSRRSSKVLYQRVEENVSYIPYCLHTFSLIYYKFVKRCGLASYQEIFNMSYDKAIREHEQYMNK